MQGDLSTILQASLTAVVAVALLSAGFEGYLWWVGQLAAWARVGIGLAGLLLFIPEGYTDLAGIGLAAVCTALSIMGGSRASLAT